MQKDDYFTKVYAVVSQIPSGKVTTYGSIASHLGIRGGARLVGWALNQTLSNKKLESLPCHRVVNRNGDLSGKVYFGGTLMEDLLRQEGVEFLENGKINLEKHYWDPGKS